MDFFVCCRDQNMSTVHHVAPHVLCSDWLKNLYIKLNLPKKQYFHNSFKIFLWLKLILIFDFS